VGAASGNYLAKAFDEFEAIWTVGHMAIDLAARFGWQFEIHIVRKLFEDLCLSQIQF
jgi:hypothetical protein